MHTSRTSNTTRRIAVVSSSRADYGHLYWVLKELQAHEHIDLHILAMAAHGSPKFGLTVEQFERDGFEVRQMVECLLDSDSDVGMAKTIGLGVLGLADRLGQLRPDLLLIIADRYEMLAPAATALALRIPIAHIEGGEISEGAIDDAVRNALTKMSHLHFVSTEQARRRVCALGEQAWRVHRAGAPSLDHLTRSHLPDRSALERKLNFDLQTSPWLVSFHPVTLIRKPQAETDALFNALDTLEGPMVFCFPNADTGHAGIIERATAFATDRDRTELFINLEPLQYWGLLKQVRVMIGNSSSGIMESPSLQLPCVNIGIRQRGRERAANIIDAPANTAEILNAIRKADSSEFRQQLNGMKNPYGDSTAAKIIARILSEVPLDDRLLIKSALALKDGPDACFNHDG
ncbi:MAG: UDP-N-acetylglucosamine 2-epimerase [Pseudomonadota bacterium]